MAHNAAVAVRRGSGGSRATAGGRQRTGCTRQAGSGDGCVALSNFSFTFYEWFVDFFLDWDDFVDDLWIVDDYVDGHVNCE